MTRTQKKGDKFPKDWNEIVVKAWTDEAFKKRLLQNPRAAMKEHGIDWPKDISLHVHENTEKEIHLTLPVKPEEAEELTPQELEKLSAAGLPWKC